MKLKVEIDIDEIWCEGEETITEALINAIKQDTIRAIRKEMKDDTERKINQFVQKAISETWESQIQEEVKRTIETGEIIKNPGNSKQETIKINDWILEKFHHGFGWNNPESILKEKAKQIGQDLRDRYDQLFATQIVVKMHEQGLLKDGVFESLMTKKDK